MTGTGVVARNRRARPARSAISKPLGQVCETGADPALLKLLLEKLFEPLAIGTAAPAAAHVDAAVGHVSNVFAITTMLPVSLVLNRVENARSAAAGDATANNAASAPTTNSTPRLPPRAGDHDRILIRPDEGSPAASITLSLVHPRRVPDPNPGRRASL
jgi:hypothetical protein